MFQYLFFCCSAKQKEQTKTFTLEDIDLNNNNKSLKDKNSDNINCLNTNNNNIITENNNNIEIVEEKIEEKVNEKESENNIIIKSDKRKNIFNDTIFKSPAMKPPPSILTINNINNININFNSKENSNNSIILNEISDKKFKKISTDSIPKIKKIKTQSKENDISAGENSKEFPQQNKSFISFSNITIKYNNNGAESSINISDTEILSGCELILTGDIFYNKEIIIDRSGIKNSNFSGINKNKNRKACEIRFGVVHGDNKNGNILQGNLINNIEEKNNNIINNGVKSPNSKNTKISSIKNKQKKKIQRFSSFSSLNNNFFNNKNSIDIALNLPYDKVQKKLNENNRQLNKNNSNDNIILFILKYDITLDIFQLISIQDNLPLLLLLNYNYALKFHTDYYILIGGIKIRLRVTKNEKNESILQIYTNNSNDKKKTEKMHSFNPLKEKMPITIGRSTCTINLEFNSVSKLHAQINYIYEYDEFFIIDCNSTNGTYLLLQNSVNSLYIKQNHVFKICETIFKIDFTNFEK